MLAAPAAIQANTIALVVRATRRIAKIVDSVMLYFPLTYCNISSIVQKDNKTATGIIQGVNKTTPNHDQADNIAIRCFIKFHFLSQRFQPLKLLLS